MIKKSEKLIYIEIIKDIIAHYYEKEMAFYDDLGWYSREHGRYITIEELEDWVKEITTNTKEL